jgi:hypothetical protein
MNPVSTGVCSGILKPKYKVIASMLGEGYYPTKGLDVFIDFNTLFTSISTYKKFMSNLPFQDHVDIDMISTILLTFKHWKDFTRKWNDVRIFGFVNAFDMGVLPESKVLKSYLVPYVNKYHQERFSQVTYYWNEAMKMVETVLKYVPNMYMIRCDRFDSFMIPNVIDDYTKNQRDRVIISGNALFTNYQFSNQTKTIYSRIHRNGVMQLSDPLMIVQSITKTDDEILSQFTTNKVFYNLLNAIVGDFDRGIIGLPQTSITAVAYTILRCVERHEIPADPKSVESILPAIDHAYHDYITQAYPLVDVDMHAQLIPQSLIEKVRSQMIDLYDVDGLNAININGLNLLELL